LDWTGPGDDVQGLATRTKLPVAPGSGGELNGDHRQATLTFVEPVVPDRAGEVLSPEGFEAA